MCEYGGRLRNDEVAFQARLYSDPIPTRRGLHLGRRDWVNSNLAAYGAAGSRALEVGVGCGVFAVEMAAMGFRVSAVDINPRFLEHLSGNPNIETHFKDGTKPLGIGEHDLALCTEVLEHVAPQSSQDMVNSLYGALRPGGVLILSTPQTYSVVEIISRLFRFGPFLALARKMYGQAEELGHINLLTAGGVEQQLRSAGFEILVRSRFGFYLPVVAEFGGEAGWRLLEMLGRHLATIPVLRGALWTQGWVARRPA
jgi:SAM-dependent methyltransferase